MQKRFRIWDKDKRCWFKPTYEAYKGNLEDLTIGLSGDLFMRTPEGFSHESSFPNRFEIVQWTGLTDKNGKEIYEGDVVRTRYKGEDLWNNPSVIIYGVEKWNYPGFEMTPEYYDEGNNLQYFQVAGDIEVIGSIRENPDLLENNKAE